MRVILMTGKGGVGKTSVAAATGLRCAELGHRTLVLSTDPAHSLADSFDQEMSHEPQQVRPNLWGAELDALMELESNWGAVKRYITEVLQARGLQGVQAEELAILPGMDEIFGLVRMKRHYDEGDFEVLIIDSAPTGTALRLLSIPEVGGWYMRRFYKPLQGMSMALRPIVEPLFKPLAGFSLPNQEVMDAPYEFYEQIEELEKVLTDSSKTSVRLVTNPERMVIKESLRAHAYLSLYNVGTDLVIANRIIPEEVSDPFFQRWKENQKIYREEIHESFNPLPVKEVPLFTEEVCGFEALERLKDTLYGDGEDPTQVYYEETTIRIVPNDSGYNLELYLPGMAKDKIQLNKTGDELNIRIGNHRRNLVLPQTLAAMQPAGAKMEEDYLKIRFADAAVKA
ncbi:MAG: TRC40/GET3/ArsA family transport-energizing ATPase [Cyanobacteria bacterium J06641_5]